VSISLRFCLRARGLWLAH